MKLFPVAFCNGNAFENLKQLGPNFSRFNAMPAKLWLVLPYEIVGYLFRNSATKFCV